MPAVKVNIRFGALGEETGKWPKIPKNMASVVDVNNEALRSELGGLTHFHAARDLAAIIL